MAVKPKDQEVALTDEELAEIANQAPAEEPHPLGWVPPDLRHLPAVMTTTEAMDVLRVNVRTLREGLRTGRIPGGFMPGKREWRILREPFLKWLLDNNSRTKASVFTTPNPKAVKDSENSLAKTNRPLRKHVTPEEAVEEEEHISRAAEDS